VSAFRNTELFRATGLTLNSSTDHVTAGITNGTTGVAGAIDISRISNGLLIASIGGVSGSSPTLALFFDVADAYGNWVQTSPGTAIGGVVATAAGTTYGVINNGYQMTNLGRIRWTIGGTGSPTFTGVSFSIHGRP
jgi:hypothetical protein